MSANTVNTNLNRALLIGGDKVAAYSQFFVLPNKTAAVSAFNLPDCYEVRFQIGFFDDKITEQYCKCFLPPEVAGKYVGSVYLKCPSCNEEDAYVRVTNTNPFIVLGTPQALGNTIRAVLVHSVTGEVFDVSDPVAQEELAKARVFIHFDVDYEAKTEAERGCVEFCPPLGDWNIDCETKGWTEIPNCYPTDWFEEIEDCGKVSSIDIAADGVITLDKADKVHLGYLLKEPKWWACNAVYDCYGNLIGYGMQNQCNDCPPCVPDKVAASIEQPPTPVKPITLYINAKNDPYTCTTGNYLCDTVAAFTGTPENVTIEKIGDLGFGLRPFEQAVLDKCNLLPPNIETDNYHIAVDDGSIKEFGRYDDCVDNTLPAGMLDNITRIVYVSCNAKPQYVTCDYEGEVWDNDKLADNTIFSFCMPENGKWMWEAMNADYIIIPSLRINSADETVDLMNITAEYMRRWMSGFQNDPNAPVYEFATDEEILQYIDSIGNYRADIQAWCDSHNIRDNLDTDEEYNEAVDWFIDATRGILTNPRFRSTVRLYPDAVIPKVEVVKASFHQDVVAMQAGIEGPDAIVSSMRSMMGYLNLHGVVRLDRLVGIGRKKYVPYIIPAFFDINEGTNDYDYYVDSTFDVCVFRFVVMEDDYNG